jgi:hypothetical protein
MTAQGLGNVAEITGLPVCLASVIIQKVGDSDGSLMSIDQRIQARRLGGHAAAASTTLSARSYCESRGLLGCEAEVVTEEALHWYIHDRLLKEAVRL